MHLQEASRVPERKAKGSWIPLADIEAIPNASDAVTWQSLCDVLTTGGSKFCQIERKR